MHWAFSIYHKLKNKEWPLLPKVYFFSFWDTRGRDGKVIDNNKYTKWGMLHQRLPLL